MIKLTPNETPSLEEQISKHYAACLDSVALINAGQPEGMEDAEWADCLERNKSHLRIMLAKDYWTDQDLTQLQEAVNG